YPGLAGISWRSQVSPKRNVESIRMHGMMASISSMEFIKL
ncbi:hypothetical protein FOPG_06626, partial [Fusarium oxysporum f. sp. conglutinans race 2 54008]